MTLQSGGKDAVTYIDIKQADVCRPGRIYRRVETVQDIDTPCDFRKVKQYRYIADVSTYTPWAV